MTYKQRYYAENREALKAYSREYYSANKESQRAKQRQYRTKNKKKILAKIKEWQKANPKKKSEYVTAARRKKNGFTRELFDSRLVNQGNKCPICKHLGPNSADHCHVSNTPRGVLCSACNRMLGIAKDDPEILRAAARYLEMWKRTA